MSLQGFVEQDCSCFRLVRLRLLSKLLQRDADGMSRGKQKQKSKRRTAKEVHQKKKNYWDMGRREKAKEWYWNPMGRGKAKERYQKKKKNAGKKAEIEYAETEKLSAACPSEKGPQQEAEGGSENAHAEGPA